MRRPYCWMWIGFVCELMTAAVAWAAGHPSETLLPRTTTGWLSISNYSVMDEHWKQTQLGQLIADPVMEPFAKDTRAQFHKRWSKVRDRLGVGLDDLKGIPGGEVAVALIEPGPNQSATALLCDVTGHVEAANALLAKAKKNLLQQGATESQAMLGGVTLLVFNLPPPVPTAGGPAAAAGALRQTVYFLAGNLLGASDNLAVTQGIVRRLAGAQGGSLAELTGYQMVMKRCAADAEAGYNPQVRWFVFPLGYAEAARAATPAEKHRKGKSLADLMRHQGVQAIQGVGGFVDFSSDGFEILHRTAVYAPPPYQKSMKMASFPNGADFTPQPWVPRDVATYTTFYFDVLNGFDNFAPLFDELAGEGEEGAWHDALESLSNDPTGPQIDLRKELILNLGRRVTMFTDYQMPITTTSERLLFAVEAKDEKAVAAAIRKSVQTDDSMKRRVVEGRVIWEIVEEHPAGVPSIKLNIPSPPGKKGKEKENDHAEPAAQPHFLPHGAITVANGQLLMASHIDFLLKVLKPIEPREQLAHSLDFRQVMATIDKLGLKTQCARGFARTDEEYRPSYELIRQGKMPESESLLGRMLNTLSASGTQGTVRTQRIQGQNLPDYQVVRRSMGPGGMAASSEPTGWFIKGVLLRK